MAALLILPFSLPQAEYLIYSSFPVTGPANSYARAFASDHLGNAYFFSYSSADSNWRIKKLPQDQDEITTIGGAFGFYAQMAIDPNLWIWVFESGSSAQVKKVDYQGNVVLSFGNSTSFSYARAIATDGSTVWLSHDAPWVCAGPGKCGWSGYGKIEAYSASNGSLLASYSMPWRYGRRMAYSNGKIFVAGQTDLYCGTQGAWIINASDGSVLASFVPGRDSSNCFTPDFAFADSKGYFYLGSASYSEGKGVKKFDSWGNAIEHLAVPGGYPGEFIGMASVDERRYVYALDADGNGNTAGDNIIRMAYNIAPLAPAGLFPSGSLALHSKELVFSWNPSYDADGDSIAYEMYLSQTNGSPTSLSLASTTSDTSITLTPNPGTYYWLIRAKDSFRQADSATEQTSYSFINSAPTSPTYSDQKFTTRDTFVWINWSASSDADGDSIVYRYYLGDSPDSLSQAYSGDQTSYQFSGFSWGQTYYFKISAEDQFGAVSEGQVSLIQVNFKNSTPSAPYYSNLSFLTRDSSVALSWNPSSDDDGDPLTYRLYLGNSAQSLSEIYSGAGTSYAFSGFSWGSTYYWKVKAEDSFGGTSEGLLTLVSVNFDNSSPTSPLISGLSSRGVHSTGTFSDAITWIASSDPDGDPITYNLYQGLNSSNLALASSGISANSYLVDGLNQWSTYYFLLEAVDPYGGKATSSLNQVSYYLDNGSPEPIVYSSTWGTIVTRDNSAFLSWEFPGDPEADAVSLNLLVGTNPASLEALDLGDATWFLWEGLSYETTYYFKIKAQDSFGAIREGELKSFLLRFKNSAPPLPLASSGAGVLWRHKQEPFGETISWNADGDADSDPVTYSVYWGQSSPSAMSKVLESGMVDSYFASGLNYGATYYWQIIARDPYSVSSGPVNFLQVLLENTPPSAPVIVSGAGRVATRSTTETLSWNPSNDPEGDSITYAVFVGTSAGQKNLLVQNLAATSYGLSNIAFGTTYYIQIGAKDAFGAWGYSATETLIHDFLNNPPGASSIQGEALRGVHSTTPFSDVLSWSSSSDPDGDAVVYLLMTGTSPAELVHLYPSTSTTVSIRDLQLETTYYGLVMTSDIYGSATKGSAFSWSYHLDNNSPDPFVYTSTWGTLLTRSTTVYLSWQDTRDPEGDPVHVSLWAGTNPLALNLLMEQGNLTGYLYSGLSFDATYYWKLTAQDSFGAFREGEMKSFSLKFKNSPPQAPGFLDIQAYKGVHSTNTFSDTLRWQEVSDPDGDPMVYRIHWGRDSLNLPLLADGLAATSLELENLSLETTYYAKIAAYDPYGGSSTNSEVSWRYFLENDPPEPIIYLSTWGTISSRSKETFLSWQQSLDPEGDPVTYWLWLGTSPASLTLAAEGTLTGYLWEGLSFGGTYYFRVDAIDSFGATREGDLKKIIWQFKNSPPAPATATSGSGVLWRHKTEPFGQTLTWQADADGDGDPVVYSVYWGTSSQSMGLLLESPGISSYFVSGLNYGQSYYWQVIARDPYSVSSGPVNFLQVFLENTPPSAPVITGGMGNLLGRDTSQSIAWSLSLDSDGDAVSYSVFLGTSPHQKIPAAQNLVLPSLTLTGLEFETTYYVQVGAKDSFGAWAYSTTDTIHHAFLNNPPQASVVEGGSLIAVHAQEPFSSYVQWTPTYDPEADPVFYILKLGTSPAHMQSIFVSTLTAVTIPDLHLGATYYGFVISSDSYGATKEGPSSSWSYYLDNHVPNPVVYTSTWGTMITRSQDVLLSWQEPLDPNNDPVIQKLFIGTSSVTLELALSGSESQFTWDSLEFGTSYYFRVELEDSFGAIRQGETKNFVLIFRNEAPEIPAVLGSPLRGVHSLGPFSDVLQWSSSVDPDGDPVLYDVLLGTTPASLNVFGSSLTENSLVLQNLSLESTYYLAVLVKDAYGAASQRPLFSLAYYLDNKPPEPLVYTSTWGVIPTRLQQIYLSWQSPVDPDNDPVDVTLLVGQSSNSLSPVSLDSAMNACLWSGLSWESTYYFKLKAQDSLGAVREGEIKSFMLRFQNSAPPLAVAKEGSGVLWRHKAEPFGETIAWNDEADADGDPLTYSVFFGSRTLSKVFEGPGIDSFFVEGLHYNTPYYWQVIIKDPYSISSGPVHELLFLLQNNPPQAPQISAGTGIRTTREADEMLQWNPSHDPEDDPVTYAIFTGTDPALMTTAAQNLMSTEFALTGMSFGTTYYWQVAAKDSFGAWAYSPMVSIAHNFLNSPLKAPAIQGDFLRYLHVKEPFDEVISWEPAHDSENDTVGYALYLSSAYPQSLDSLIARTTGTALGLSGLRFNTTYYAVLIASDAYGMASQSSIYSFLYKESNSFPSEPIYTSASGLIITRENRYSVSWRTSGDPDNDSLLYSLWAGTEAARLQLVQKGEALSGDLLGLSFGTTHYWRVSVEDSFGATREGSTGSVVLAFKNSPPSTPLIKSAAGVLTTRISSYTLTWQGSLDEDQDSIGYKVFWGTSTTGLTAYDAGNQTSLAFDSLGFGTTYYFKVAAFDSYGAVTESPLTFFYLDFLNNEPRPVGDAVSWLPQGEVASDKNEITLNWPVYIDPEGDPVTYQLYLILGESAHWQWSPAGENFAGAVYSGHLNSVTLENLNFNVSYAYQVIIQDSQGASLPGPSGTFSLVPQSAQIEPYNWPNPFRVNDGTNFVVTALDPLERVKIAVYSAYQDLIWEKEFGRLGAGVHHLHWDGRDSLGRPVFSGFYLAVVQSPKGRDAISMVAIR